VWSFPFDHLRLFLRDPLAPLFQHILPLLLMIVILMAVLGMLSR
jgi:hypothetical protein